jgi:hypothetical protein
MNTNYNQQLSPTFGLRGGGRFGGKPSSNKEDLNNISFKYN